jgi:hypothetical protein
MNPNLQMPTLADLIELASDFVEKTFNKYGRFEPMYHAVTADCLCMIVPFPPINDRNEGLKLVRSLFLEKDVVAYVFTDEAWLVKSNEEPVGSLDQHPDRCEVIMLSAESEHEATIFGYRNIIRPKNGRPYLGPLELDTPRDVKAEYGDIIGMLARRTTLQ